LTWSALKAIALAAVAGTDTSLTIGETVARSGVGEHTLRYYERVGLIAPVARGVRGERRYAAADLEWIEFLKRLRATGMPVRDMARFAELRRGGPATVPARRQVLEDHRGHVRETIRSLERDLAAIEAKLQRLEGVADDKEACDDRVRSRISL
jgi:DNA-binding transcriptional MerR regulator